MEPDRSADAIPSHRKTDPVKGRADKSRSADPKDRGAGTIAAIGICLVLLGFSVVALVLVQVSVAAVRAATAADLAALAGADALRRLQPTDPGIGPVAGSDSVGVPGPAGACGVAGEVAARNNAVLRECTADPEAGILTVEAQVRVPALPHSATARARAGPPG